MLKVLIIPFELLLVLTLNQSFAQSKTTASLDSIRLLEDDSSKVARYLEFHELLKFERIEEATEALIYAIDLSEKLNYQKGKLDTWLTIGTFLNTNSNYDSAQVIFEMAVRLAFKIQNRPSIIKALCGQADALNASMHLKESDSLIQQGLKLALKTPIDSSMAALCYNNLGNNSFARNQFDDALNFYQQALTYAGTEPRRKAVVNKNIALIHISFKRFEKAESYLNTALNLAKEIDEKRIIAQCYDYLATVKRKMKDYESARINNRLALKHYEKVQDISNMARIHSNLSNIHNDLKEYDLAIQEMEKCLSLLGQINFPLGMSYTLKNLGEIHLQRADYEQAKDYFERAKEKSEEAGVLLVRADVAKLLSQTYAAIGDYKYAYQYQIEYKSLYDSIQKEANISRVSELEEQYQNKEKQQEIELLSAENQIALLEVQKQTNLRNYLLFAAGLLTLLIAVVYNRYQIKARANAKLKELDQLKTNFFTNISHEFRTPLTLILSPVQKLLNKINDQETNKELTIIHRNASLLTDLINQILELAKLEAGKLKLTVSKGDLHDLIQVIGASFESLAQAKSIQFNLYLEISSHETCFDEDKIRIILNNLLANAFKFTPNHGEIQLKAAIEKGEAIVSISDSGPGISEDDLQSIFKRFEQSDSNYPNTTGTGVGLTLSKELALLHRGDISVNSKPGEGATFTVRFPINKSAYLISEIFDHQTEAEISANSTKESSAIHSDSYNEHADIILIVEDNKDLLDHMTSLLSDQFTIKQAANGKEGVELAIEWVPDIIITDLMMPEMDGIELAHAVKNNEKTSHIPIILLTAKADKETKLEGLKIGADDFLTKPFDNDELTIRVQNLIKLRKNLQEKFTQKLTLEPSAIEITSPNEKFIQQSLKVVNAQISNAEFTTEQFQKEMAMSRMQLHRKLKALTGFSASEFVRDLRLKRAASLLTNQGISVSEIAYSCGFNSTSYFTQCFKEKYGVSPSKYQ